MALEHNMPPVPRNVLGNARHPGSLLWVVEYPHGMWATITRYQPAFLAECLQWLVTAFERFRVSSMDARVLWKHTVGALRNMPPHERC